MIDIQAGTINSFVALHVFNKYLSEMPNGRKIRIESVDREFANQLASDLRKLIHSSKSDAEDAILVSVISESKPDGDISISISKAIYHRNRRSRILYLDPNSVGATNANLGPNAFDTHSMFDIYTELLKDLRERLSASELGLKVVKAVSRNKPAICSVHSEAELLVELLKSGDLVTALGENLWRIGLIPDFAPNSLDRISDNSRVADILSGRSKPLSSGRERLELAGMHSGDFKDQLERMLEPLPSKFSEWLSKLEEDKSFHLWPIKADMVYDIEEIIPTPFILENGKVDPRCKLKREDVSGSLVASGRVSVYWSVKPSTPASVHAWQVELAPPSEIADEFPVLRSNKLKAERRTAALTWQLKEDDIEILAPRYVVRISALDESGNALKLVDGNWAIVESQEFILDVEPSDEDRSSSINAWSIPEGILDRVIGGRETILESSPTWELKRQDFTLSISAFEKIRIPVSRFIVEAQRFAFSNSAKAHWHSVKSPTGMEVTFDQVRHEELELPTKVQKARKKFLDLAAEKNEARKSIEAMAWDEELRKAAHLYLVAFNKALRESLSSGHLEALLLQDTVSITTSSSRGLVTGVILLPSHPLRLNWVAEHDKLLREWIAGALSFKAAQRKSQVDLALVKRIQPSNFPFLVLGGESNRSLRAFNYFEELTHGSALYLDADGIDPKLDSLDLRRVIGIARVSSSASDTSSELIGEKLQRYRNAHNESPGLRILLVNSADAKIPAAATKNFVERLGDESAGLVLQFVGYGQMSSFSNPMSQLTELQRDYSKAAETSERISPPSISIVGRDLEEMSSDVSEAHVAIVQGVASLQVAPTQGSRGLSATLRGLLTPILSEKWEQSKQLGFFTKPALEANNSKEKPELVLSHAAYLASISKLLFGSENPAGLELQVDPSALDRLRAAHSRSDWVLTLDRNIGLSLYEDLVGDALGGAYVLDYAPDFIDGLGDRLTVTTTRRDELERVISGAMEKLGLLDEGVGAPELLRTLASVSGRLALKLLGDDTGAVEALGLASTITHLSKIGSLKDTVLIPVDAHLDIFGSHARRDEESAERCDVLLLRFSRTGHSLEFLEVKARSGNIDSNLFKTMAFQVEQTHNLIRSRLFATEGPRVDAELQWSRWISLLHFYADRASLHGYMDASKLMDVHSFIDRIELNKESPTITKTGYIVSVQGKPAEVPEHFDSLKLHLLNVSQFEEMGFTTKFSQTTNPANDSLTSSFDSEAPSDSGFDNSISEQHSSPLALLEEEAENDDDLQSNQPEAQGELPGMPSEQMKREVIIQLGEEIM